MAPQKTKDSSHHEAEPGFETKEGQDRRIIKPRGLNVIWGGDPRYWVIPKEEGKPAELKMACWLEVTGTVDVKPGKKYQISFKISFKPDATGWDQAPVFMSAKIGKKGKTMWKRIKSINQIIQKSGSESVIPDETDGQFEINVPPTESDQATKLQFGLYEVWTGRWKTGLMIHDASVQEVA
ncbi:PREDICTED: protein PHLOEM PROTEIN 2-LIKE A9-like [Tarenaya hassleriana]|uniref:protein PHLOEM PROTEIN 2-LIKE A9-like n=1 Tax=Tarenaya hassleriana TaxID=28532 RepID=UPI00053C545C|nr:PREDICTED: protein PHLOEM PROTEIN 2-LIKE A9-like [Tarenaya hassleriana]